MRTPRFRVSLVAALTGGAALAGQIEQVEFQGIPQMQVSSGLVDGCGYRLVGAALTSATASRMDAVDASFNVNAGGHGLVKAGLRRTDFKAAAAKVPPAVVPLTTFWLKAGGQRATSPDAAGVGPSDSPKGYVFYGTGAPEVASLFAAVAAREPVMVGVRLKNEDVDRIYAGVVRVTEDEAKQVADCLRELIAAWDRASDTAPPGN